MAFLTFRGGVHPYDGKELSKEKTVRELLPGKELVYPLSQHIGAPAKPIVAKGDHVLAGQKIAEMGGIDISAKDAKTILGESLFKVWGKYVRRAASKSEEDIIAGYAARIGGKVCAANVVNRAQRLVRAFELGAPECVVLNEERRFAEAFALNICADEVKTGGYYVGHKR